MKSIIITLFISILAIARCFSQDVITTKTGEYIRAKVITVSPTQIEYKKFDNLDGPTYIIFRSDVASIRYENGSQETFTEEIKKDSIPQPILSSSQLYTKGQNDALRYYNGYKGAATGTFLVSLLSPAVGLIPAIATSSTKPKDENLSYPDSELMKNQDYYRGYTLRSKKIKQGKVWTNWGIALGINLVAVLVLTAGS